MIYLVRNVFQNFKLIATTTGVPQGSFLGQLLFDLYMFSLYQIIHMIVIQHSDAEDSELLNVASVPQIPSTSFCLKYISRSSCIF